MPLATSDTGALALLDQVTALLRDNHATMANVGQMVDDRFAALLAQIAPQLRNTLAGESKAQLAKLQQAAGAVVNAIRTAEAGIAEQVKLQTIRTLEELAPRTLQIVDRAGLPVATIADRVRPEFDEIVQCAALGLNTLLVGPAGSGKTTVARQVAKALNLPFGMISLTAGISESRLVGRFAPTGENGQFKYVEAPFVKIFRDGGVFLLDEMDAADANVMLALNSALANGILETPNPAEPFVKRHEQCIILAACNTWGSGADRQYVGRNQLDASTLDRFGVAQFELDYDQDFEKAAGHPAIVEWVHELRDSIRCHKVRRVASTRLVLDGTARLNAGHTLAQVKKSYFLPWTDAERRLVGE